MSVPHAARQARAPSLQAVRLAIAVGLFVVVANAGGWPLLLATVGFLLARGLVEAWRRRHAG